MISTHGRSFWILDDIDTLRQLRADVANADAHLFSPADAVRRSIPAVIDFRVNTPEAHVRLDILTDDREHVRTLVEETVRGGTHRIRWTSATRGAVTFPGIVLEGGDPRWALGRRRGATSRD